MTESKRSLPYGNLLLIAYRLSIEESEMLYILERGDDGWWKVKKKAEGEEEDGDSGLVPANYVQEVRRFK